MKITYAKDYAGDNRRKYHFPFEGLPRNKKEEKDYFLKATQAIVSRYFSNSCQLPYESSGNRVDLELIRKYATGEQSVEKYKDILIGARSKINGRRRKNTWNINWEPLDILPKKLGDVLSYLLKIKYDITSTAIDPTAMQQREDIIALTKLMTDDRFRFLGDHINELAGADLVDESKTPLSGLKQMPFKNEKQVEMAEKMGIFQLQVENAMQILLEKTADDSMSEGVYKLIKRDLLYYNIAAKYVYSVGDNVLEDWVDIRKAIIPYSPYNDFRDASYCGFFKTTSIAELVKLQCFSDDEIVEIARKYNSTSANAANRINNFEYEYGLAKQRGLGMSVLHSIQVDIAQVWWIGNKNISMEKDDGTLPDRNMEQPDEEGKRKRDKNYTFQTVYSATHIIGTDYIFNYGQERNVNYRKNLNGQMCAKLPMNIQKIDGSSMVERCIGFVDDANIANYKKRKLMQSLNAGPGIKINKAAFENVSIDGKLYSPLELIALFTDEGIMIVDDKNPWGTPNQSGSRPIDVIPSDIFQRMLGCRDEVRWNLEMIDIITGINDTFSAKQPTGQTGLGVSKIALSATENSIYRLVESFECLSNDSNRIKADKWKIISACMDDKKRDNFASKAMRYIRIGKEISWHEYGIKMEVGISDAEKMQLMQKVGGLADYRRQSGTGGIMPSDELLIYEMVRQGNIKQARLALMQIEELRQQQDQEQARQRYQENAQLQIESNMRADESRQAEIAAEAQIQAQLLNQKFRQELILEEEKAKNKRMNFAQANIYGWGREQYEKAEKYSPAE